MFVVYEYTDEINARGAETFGDAHILGITEKFDEMKTIVDAWVEKHPVENIVKEKNRTLAQIRFAAANFESDKNMAISMGVTDEETRIATTEKKEYTRKKITRMKIMYFELDEFTIEFLTKILIFLEDGRKTEKSSIINYEF